MGPTSECAFFAFHYRVVLKPGTERNGTNGTVVFRRRDEGRTDFSLYVALHRRYRNVHVATKVSTYSTEGMHCRTGLLPIAYSRKTGYIRTLANLTELTQLLPYHARI